MNKVFKYIEIVFALVALFIFSWVALQKEEGKMLLFIVSICLSSLYFGFGFLLFREKEKPNNLWLHIACGFIYSIAVIAITFNMLMFAGARELLFLSFFTLTSLLIYFVIFEKKRHTIIQHLIRILSLYFIVILGLVTE